MSAAAQPLRLARAMVDGAPHVLMATGPGTWAIAGVGGEDFADLPELLTAAHGDAAAIAPTREAVIEERQLLPVVGAPRKIVCVGLNYGLHARETGASLPTRPMLFAKWSTALTGPYDDIPLPPESDFVDWECELAFVFGRRCRRVDAAGAAGVVFGYTAANDTSMRDFQSHSTQFTAGKTWDAATPIGPSLVTTDALGGLAPDRAIIGRLNGEVVQNSRTSDLIFSITDLVVYLTTIMTMEPGDVVLTGTPAGVGFTATPPRSLQDGDVYEVDIDGIGTLRNRFVRESVAS